MREMFPVHESIDTKRGYTIYKSDDWWKAAVLYEHREKTQVGVYLWKRNGDDWTRKQKYAIDSEDDWEKDQKAVETLVEKLPEE